MENTIIKRIIGVVLPFALSVLIPASQAATRTWNPAGDGNFNNSANWSTALPGASDIAQFGSASVNGPVLNAPITVGAINFTSTGTGYDLTASNLADALTLMSTSTGAGNSAVASQVGSGNTQIDASLIFGAAAAATQQISQSNGGTLILNGSISSTNSITLNYGGGGTITINGTNSNTGSSVQTAGSNIIIGNSAAFGTSTLVLTSNGGKLTAGINLTGANAIANAISWNANATLGNSGANAFEFSGVVDLGGAARIISSATSAGVTFDNVIQNDGGGGLTIATSSGSNVTLKGANTYSGATNISGTGMVTVSSIGLAGNAGNLGTNSTIKLGSTTSSGTLAYNGAGETTDRTIDLSGTTGGATIDTTGATGGLVFSSNLTASGVGAKTLTLQGNTANNAINGVVIDSSGGATSLVKTGGGTWALGGANTYTGTTTLKNGTLSVSMLGTTGNPGNLGEASIVELGSGNSSVTLAYTGAGETTNHVFDLQGTTGSVTIDTTAGTGPLVMTGNITASGAGSKTLTLTGGNNDNIEGIISDNSASNTTSIVKTSGGTWILSGANTYSGGTTIRGGTLSVSSLGLAGNPGNLGTAATINIGNAGATGTLAYTGAGETTDRVINLSGTTGGATIDTTGATGGLVFSSNLTASGVGAKTLTLQGNTANNAINGVVVDSSGGATSLIKTGTGTWALGGANTYTGTTTLKNGTLSVSMLGTTGNPGNLGEASIVELGSGNNTVTLAYTGAGETTDHVFDLQGTIGSVTIDTTAGTGPLVITGNVTASGAGSKTLTLTGGNNDNIQGIISDNSVANTTSIVKSGSGTWILSGANTYSGGTTIRNGTLSVSSLGNSGNPGNLGTNATINIGNGGNSGTLAYTGGGETTDRVINLSGATGGAIIDTTNDTGPLIFTSDFTATGAGSKTLTLKGGNSDIIQGAIVDNSPANPTSLNKTGSGIWTLSGANTYSGGTTVTNGTLRLSGANATLGIGNVFVLSTATNLNITSGVLNAIADTATLSLAGGGTPGVADAGYAKLGTGVDEVVAALILGGMNEAPGTYGATGSGAANIMDEYFSGNGIITVVPEPSVYALVGAGSGLLLGVQRLRRRS